MYEEYRQLDLGSVTPLGWMREQMECDLVNGLVGHLDEIIPNLFPKRDDIYLVDRRTEYTQFNRWDLVGQSDENANKCGWGNAETQGNWFDAITRHSILLDNTEYMHKVLMIVDHLVNSQDDDGYLGIYDSDIRYRMTSDNAELWAKCVAMRALCGYYEYSKDVGILDVISRSVENVMKNYPIGQCSPFKVENPYGRIPHGLTITDVFEWMYKRTCNEAYLDYAVWLYEDYCNNSTHEEDIHVSNLLNDAYRFKGHACHTYEHLRTLIIAAYHGMNETYGVALSKYLEKLKPCISPSGGPIGDEHIMGFHSDASKYGYEYCSLQELLDSYISLFQKTGDRHWADEVEVLLFNAAQGARNPFESSIAYCKTDNSYIMTGPPQIPQPYSLHPTHTKYKYSPTHIDTAVCCPPNAGRIFPYYVKAMWQSDERGRLSCIFYGANAVSTVVEGTQVMIRQDSRFPFDLESTFTVSVQGDLEMELKFRIPGWCNQYDVVCADVGIFEQDGFIVLNGLWRGDTKIRIRFEAEIELLMDLNNDSYIKRGPLVYALPIEDTGPEVAREYALKPFRDTMYMPMNRNYEQYEMDRNQIQEFESICGDGQSRVWGDTCVIKGRMFNKETRISGEIRLVPMGGTVLRRVTFPDKNSSKTGSAGARLTAVVKKRNDVLHR